MWYSIQIGSPRVGEGGRGKREKGKGGRGEGRVGEGRAEGVFREGMREGARAICSLRNVGGMRGEAWAGDGESDLVELERGRDSEREKRERKKGAWRQRTRRICTLSRTEGLKGLVTRERHGDSKIFTSETMLKPSNC